MSDVEQVSSESNVVKAGSSRFMASLFNYGNMVAITIVVFLPLWFGASIIIYALNRHHPNPRVGHYTQQAAYRFYALTGALIPIATFIPGEGLQWYLVAWAVAAAVILPLSVRDLIRIRKETWHDIVPQEK